MIIFLKEVDNVFVVNFFVIFLLIMIVLLNIFFFLIKRDFVLYEIGF